MTFRLKELKNVWRFMGTQEVDLQEYDEGMVSPEFCLLWKHGAKINKKMIKILIQDMEELKNEDKTEEKEMKG